MKIRIAGLFFLFLFIFAGMDAQAGISSNDTFSLPTTGWTDYQRSTPDGDNTVWEFRPTTDNNLNDLGHYKAFAWNIAWSIPTNEAILSAEIRFDNIKNWEDETHNLWVDLLDKVPNETDSGDVRSYSDTESTDFFDPYPWFFGGVTDLVDYSEATPGFPAGDEQTVDISYTFDTSQLDALFTYLSKNGNFGIGLDSDCHYYNDGVNLRIITGNAPLEEGGGGVNSTPEPGSVFLLGAGMITLAGWQRKRQG